MVKSLDQRALQQFGKLPVFAFVPTDILAESLEIFIPLLREDLEHLAEERDDPLAIDEDTVYKAVNTVTAQLNLRARSQLMTPLRYALTGRKVSSLGNRADVSERSQCSYYYGNIGFSQESGKVRGGFETPQENNQGGIGMIQTRDTHGIVIPTSVVLDMHCNTYLRLPCLPACFGPRAGPRFWAVL
jgi:hypothetical protein